MRESDILRTVVKAFGLYLILLFALDVRDLILYAMSERLQSNADDRLYFKYMYVAYGGRAIYLGLAAFFLLYKAGPIANAIAGKDREGILFEFTRSTSIELVVIAIGNFSA